MRWRKLYAFARKIKLLKNDGKPHTLDSVDIHLTKSRREYRYYFFLPRKIRFVYLSEVTNLHLSAVSRQDVGHHDYYTTSFIVSYFLVTVSRV